jgi:hypothetical protein
MPKAYFVEIACESCSAWFPPPDFIGDDPSFECSWLIGISVDCPSCGRLTDCSDDTIRIQAKHDEFLGIETYH